MDSKANQLAPIDNFDEAYILAQYAHENNFRSTTFPKLLSWMQSRLDIQGSELIDPTPPGTEGNPAIIPPGPSERKGKFEPEPGFYQGFPEIVEGKRFYFYWDKTQWSLWDLGSLPEKEGVDTVRPEGQMLPKESAVYQADRAVESKVLLMVSEDEKETTHIDVADTTAVYGLTSGTRGWGFPIKGREGIKSLALKIRNNDPITQARYLIYRIDRDGLKLIDKTITVSLAGDGLDKVVDLDLSDIAYYSPVPLSLWGEVYFNAAAGIFRVNPAQVFTTANGYPFPRTTVSTDMGVTRASQGSTSLVYDVYHEVTAVAKKIEGLTDWMKNEVSKVSLTEKKYVTNVQSDTGVPYGTPVGVNYNGWGWTGAANDDFIGVQVKIGVKTNLSQYRLIIREQNLSGEILVDYSFAYNTPITPTSEYILNILFDSPVENPNSSRLYYELYTDGGIHIYRTNPAVLATQSGGYEKMANPKTTASMGESPVTISESSVYADVDHSIILSEEYQISDSSLKYIEKNIKVESPSTYILPRVNYRVCFTGSSVTWADGYLQSGYVGQYIKWMQSQVAQSVLAENFTNGVVESNRKHFLGKALRLSGAGQEIEFEITGDEVSIVQSIDRNNDSASDIEVYIDGNLYDTFNNYNPSPIGNDTKSFVGDGTAVMFDLGRSFTYGHSVLLNGSAQAVTHNVTQGTGFTIPSGSDCAIIRRLGIDENGKVAVTHWLWFKNAPGAGQIISISFEYGAKITYEKTTIGENSSGAVECPYGDGDVSFDPLTPAGISSGLDFRQTDERVVKTYRFLEEKKRTVRLRIKGNYEGSTGTPYFVFNFATNRYFHFQNAGIGGWDLWDLDVRLSEDYLRGWQRIVEFNPDKLVIETTPNDDWKFKDYKIYKTDNVTLSEIRSIKTLPLRQIAYQSGNDTYNVTRYRGLITDISIDSVTFDGTIETTIVDGDIVVIGNYYSNNHDYIERLITGVDGNTVYFDKPISEDEVIHSNLEGFIGKDIGIRSFDVFKDKLQGIIDNLRRNLDCPVYLLENPMPNLLGRDLWGYPTVMNQLANDNEKVFSVNYMSLRKWQESIPKLSVTLNVADAVMDEYLGKRVIEFGTNGQNVLAGEVKLNGISIYGTRAVVQNGWAYVPHQTRTGTQLNKAVADITRSGQVYNARPPRVIILDDTLTTGQVVAEYASLVWSADSTHMNNNSSILYADFLRGI